MSHVEACSAEPQLPDSLLFLSSSLFRYLENSIGHFGTYGVYTILEYLSVMKISLMNSSLIFFQWQRNKLYLRRI